MNRTGYLLGIPEHDLRAFLHIGDGKIRLFDGDGGGGGGGDGDSTGVGVGEVGAASPGAGGDPAGPGDPGISDGFEADWGAVTSGGLTASEQAAADAAAAAANAAEAQAAADAAAAQAAAAAEAQAAATAAAHAATAIGQAQAAIANQSLSQEQAAQAAMSLSAITGMDTMDSMMAVTDGFGTAPGLSAQGPSHSSGVSFADIAVAQALGFGNQDVNSGQTVNQAMAAAAVHSGLNSNIGQVMGAIGGPVVGMIATAANAVAQGHSVSSVVGQIAASIVGTAISNATGLAVNANTVNAIASGQIGQAAMGLAIGQVAQSTGLSVGAVTAAMSGNLGAAVANTVMGQVIGAAAQSMSAGPLGAMAIGTIASQSGIPAGIASSINQSAIGQAVNSATSAVNSSISSAGIGVPGGAAGISAAVSAASSGAGASAPSQGDLLVNAVNSGSLVDAAKLQTPVPGAPAGPSTPSKSDKYWQNLYSDLGMEFSKPPAQKANNTANEMYANQAKAQALIDAEREYTDIFGKLTPDVAAAISSATDPVKYVDGLYTTDSEARDIWRKTVGTEPTEFDLMEIIGLDEGQAGSIADNRANTTAEEATAFFKDLYGKDFTPTEEQLQSVMGPRPEAAAKADIQDIYTKDKNWVTEDEAKQFWKDAGNKGSMPQSFMDELLMTSETGAKSMAETYRIRKEDLDATTFDGANYKDQNEAQAAAIKAGYNNYTFGDKNYYLMSPDQAETLKADIAAGKTAGPRPDAFFTSIPGMSLEQQLAAAGNPEEYAYKQGDTITVVGKRMEVPSYEDLEAWDAYKEEKRLADGDNFQSFLTEQFSILQQAMKGAPEDSIAKVMADAAMFGYGKMAQLTEAFSRTGEAMGIPQAERGTNIAKQVQSWSNKIVDQGIQNAEAAVLANVAAVTKESIAAERGVKPSDISTAELYAQKTAALFKQIPNNPLGVSLFLAGEGIQEIPLLAVSGGVGGVLKNVIGKSVGLSASVGTNVALNGAESFGGNYGEVKEYLTKQGVPASQIEALAVKSGLEGMAVGMLTSYVGDRALIKSFMGDLATDSFGKVIASNSTKEWFLGNFEGSLQNMSAQIGKYGSIKNEDEWLNAGIMEGFAQKGIAAGVLTADALSQVVAKDYDGKPVTYQQIISGEKTFDPKTIDKSFSYGTGVNLGDAIGYHTTFLTNPDITPDEYFYTAQAFRDNGLDDVTPQDIASIVGSPGEMAFDQIEELATPFAENKLAQLNSPSITPTQVEKIVSDALAQNPSLTEDQVREIVTGVVADIPAGVTSDAVANIVKSEVATATKDLATTKDIETAIAGIEFPSGISAEDVSQSIADYMTANPGLSLADVASKITEATKDLATTAGTETAIADALKGYATTQDIKDAISGIEFPAGLTEADVTSAIKTYMTANPGLSLADVASKIGEATKGLATSEGVKADIAAAVKGFATNKDIETAIANIEFPVGLTKEDVATQIKDALEANPNLTAEDVSKSIAAYMEANPGLSASDVSTAISDAVSGLATQASLEQLQTDLSEEIKAAKDIGLEGDAALQAGLDSLSEKMGLNQTDLLDQLGTTAADLKTQFAADIATSQEATAAEIASTKTALETAIADAKAAGLEGDEALQAAIDAVAADQQTNAADLLEKLGTTEANLKAEFETGLAGVASDIETTRTALQDAVKAAQDIGLEGDAALQAAIDSVAATQETSAADLLTKLGTTEEALRADMETGFADVETSIADTRTALETAIADAVASGLEGDAALEAAIDAVAEAQKTSADDLLTKLGTTEADLKTEFAAGLAGVSTEIADTRKALEDAIKAAQDLGLEGDTALQTAIETVAADLGTTKEALLTQLGTTEETLRTELATGITGLETQMKEQYDALTTEQKALADALTAQGTTLADAIAAAQESTATQISELEAATSAQYEALTAEQKDLADALTAQGTTLSDAIAAAQEQTAGQITDVETRLTDAIAAAEATGLSRDQAITAAVESVAADLGTTKADLLTQLGTTEQALRTEFTTGLAGVSAEVKAAYDSLTADQKALADQLAQQGVDLTTAIQTAQEQTQTQIGELTADVQAKFDALTTEQKALATSLQQQGVDLNTAIETAQQQTQQQIADLGTQVDTRINELMQQGQTYQQATQQAFAEVNAKNQEMAGLIGTQGRAASQQDIDALNQMLGGQRSMDLAYDVTGDKQITQADIDFLTQVVGGTKTDWTAPQQSPWAATGLYGQIQANELQRQQDLAAAEAQRQAEQQAAAEQARQESVRGGLRTTALQGQQQLQALQQQLPQAMQMAQTTSTPIYGEMGPYLDLGSPLDFDFFKPSAEKQAGTKQAQPTKIAAGGYIDDLLAEGMTVDDLLNLLR